MTAFVLPLLAITPNLFLAGTVLMLVTVSYAFTINPASAELGDAVDRRGSTSYAVAYAVYNAAYALGMIGVDTYIELVTDSAHHLQLLHILLIVSALFIVCLPLFLLKAKAAEATEQENVPPPNEEPPASTSSPFRKPKSSPTRDEPQTPPLPPKPNPTAKSKGSD